MANSILVQGMTIMNDAGIDYDISHLNGEYAFEEVDAGRNLYRKQVGADFATVAWDDLKWNITITLDAMGGFGLLGYMAYDDVAYPYLETSWDNNSGMNPELVSVTEIVPQVDYVSTLPWNDPYDPWPACNQVYLSAAAIAPSILTLRSFDPGTDYISAQVIFANDESDYPDVRLIKDVGSSLYMVTTINDGTAYFGPYYVKRPWKQVNETVGWDNENLSQVETLVIQPVATALTPWELRRIRLLEYI